jgi:hypothetical protein
MITVRRAGDRGHENYNWLDTQHTFSFSEHHDPQHMGFRALRVINEDRVKPESGFGTHCEQNTIPEGETQNRLRLVASADGREGSVTVHQDAAIYVARLEAGREVAHAIAGGRHAWVQVARGAVEVNGTALAAGDGAAISEEKAVAVVAPAGEAAEVLVFDLG